MEQYLPTIHQWMTGGTALAALGCFLWGLASVLLSPCHLASIPLIVGYVGGQDVAVRPRGAVLYAACFSLGLFATIALVGLICALAGRMLGDVGAWWTIPVGLVLIWLALDRLGLVRCALPGTGLDKLRLKGLSGALWLGLCYGLLSGTCTFGFLAPILAIITVQGRLATGLLFILLFGIGHCLPIVAAGSSTALVGRLLQQPAFHEAGRRFRMLAGVVLALMGLYFVLRPFITV